jgi:hypothetical protein
MWKTIVLCASLFTGVVLGLASAARVLQPEALPAAAAIGLCLIGMVLILAAPSGAPAKEAQPWPPVASSSGASGGSSPLQVSGGTTSTDGAAASAEVLSAGGRGRLERGLPIPNSRIL